MRIVSNATAGMHQLAQHQPPSLSREAKVRLQMIAYYQAEGRNVSKTCRHFGYSRPMFYRWLHRYDPRDLRTLEDRSSVPLRRRRPTWTVEEVVAVREVREEYPRWGKDKLVIELGKREVVLATSKVGRILRHLQATGQLREPVVTGVARQTRVQQRPYAVRKPKDYVVAAPGDLVQVDTLDVRPEPGMVLKQFTGRDMISRWDVLEVGRRATAAGAAAFLERLLERMPFPVQGVQIDGGSEFKDEFEQACQEKGLRLFVLPPRSPKLNGQVERAQRTHTEEFWEVTVAEPTLEGYRAALRHWERVYNTIRPHQALDYLTPLEFVTAYNEQQARKEAV